MGKLMQRLVDYDLMKDYATTIDWFLSEDDKFPKAIGKEQLPGWTSNDVGRFTKRVKSSIGINSDNYDCFSYAGKTKIQFPKQKNRSNSKYPKIYMTKGNGEGRDLLRHIRNGIAHGNATIFPRDHTYVIELIDFDKDAKTQTAYMLFELKVLKELVKINKSMQLDIAKKSKLKKKSKK